MEKVEGWRNGEDEAIFEWKWWRESRPNEKRWREKRENGEKRDEDEVESEGMMCKHVVRVYIGGLALGLTTNEMQITPK